MREHAEHTAIALNPPFSRVRTAAREAAGASHRARSGGQRGPPGGGGGPLLRAAQWDGLLSKAGTLWGPETGAGREGDGRLNPAPVRGWPRAYLPLTQFPWNAQVKTDVKHQVCGCCEVTPETWTAPAWLVKHTGPGASQLVSNPGLFSLASKWILEPSGKSEPALNQHSTSNTSGVVYYHFIHATILSKGSYYPCFSNEERKNIPMN